MESTPSSKPSHGGNVVGVTVGVGVSVILVIVTLIIVLILVLVYLRYKSKKDKSNDYTSVPTEDTNILKPRLPYPMKVPRPTRVQVIDDPKPPTTFVKAMQLDTSGGTGYPFVEPQALSLSDLTHKQVKKRNGRSHVLLHTQEPVDNSDGDNGSQRFSDHTTPSPIGSGSPSRQGKRVSSPMVETLRYDDQPKLPEICIQLTYNEHNSTFVVKIERVAFLPFREDGELVDAYVRLLFIPKLAELPQRKTAKTRSQRGTSPVFDEELCYEAMTGEELINSTLHIEVLDYLSYGKHNVLGQADLPLVQVKFDDGGASITLPLHPPKVKENLGTVLLSLCYSPDSKKLSVIILRAKDLNRGNSRETDAQAKVWITLGGDKILARLRTRRKQQSCSPIFNEALTCVVEASQMKNVAVNVALTNEHKNALKKELGQVILCSQSSAEEFRHWNDVIASPGKQMAEWHELK